MGALALAVALARPHGARIPLAVGALLIGVATTVPCSTGCPIPIVEATTAQDLVHFAAAGTAFSLWPVATWAAATTGPLPRLSMATTSALALLLTLLGPLTIVDPHGPLVAVGQRLLVLAALAWLAAASAALVTRP